MPLGGQPRVEGIVLESIEGAAATQTLSVSGFARHALRNLHMRLSGAKLPADLLGMARFVADYYLSRSVKRCDCFCRQVSMRSLSNR